MARVRTVRLGDRGIAKNSRHDITRGDGGTHFDPALAARFDRKLVRTPEGKIEWRDPSPVNA